MTAESVRFEDVIAQLQQKREQATLANEEAQKALAQANRLLEQNKKTQKTMNNR